MTQGTTKEKSKEIVEILVLLEQIERLGWKVTEDEEDDCFYFEGKAPSFPGNSFNVQAKGETAQAIIHSIYEAYQTFDVAQETYYLLDETGHGVVGVPWDMREVYRLMEEFKDETYRLYQTLNN